MPDEEIYKITFDLDSGVASELNSLNNRLSQIQARTKVLDRGFKDKVEQSALVGAFAGGMQMERNKANATVIENKILKRVVINKVQESKKEKGNVISYETFKRAAEQVQMYKKESMLKSQRISTLGYKILSLQGDLTRRNVTIEDLRKKYTTATIQIQSKNKTINMLAEQLGVAQRQVHGKIARSQMIWNKQIYGQYLPSYQPPENSPSSPALIMSVDKFVNFKQKIG